MKNRVCLILLFICCLLAGCRNNRISLQFNLPQDFHSTIRIVFYASNSKGGATIENVAVVNNGTGKMDCPFVNPAIVYIYPNASQPRQIAIFARRGNEIAISGPSSNPYSWQISGNDINIQISEWRNANADALFKATPEEMNALVAKFVRENPASEASPFLLLTSFSRDDDDALFRSLWFSLAPEANAAFWSRLAARTDLLTGYPRTPGRLYSIALRSLQNGMDTIRPDSAAATMLFFWQNTPNSSLRKEWIDSIRALAKEFPDSSSRIIADACIEPDSLTWRSAISKDSLKNVARLWIPAGLADSRIINLNVPRAPFYIVFSRDGHQRYRGSDPSEALSAFRSLMKKED